MSQILVVLLYFAGLGSAVASAQLVAKQYDQPWVVPAMVAVCCLATARYVARGIS